MGEACLRITISIKHEDAHFQSLVNALKKSIEQTTVLPISEKV
jgi:7-keto-8-aminopelargonate synthetase-like enzyme